MLAVPQLLMLSNDVVKQMRIVFAEVFWVMAVGFYIMGLLIKERAEASYIHTCSR